jgi:putative membrane protein
MRYPIALLLHVSASLSWTSFSIHPSTVIGIVALAALYVWRARVGEREGAPPLGRAKPTLFGVGLVLMFFSLNGWLHDLSDSYLFSAHMVQHLILVLVIAPLMLMGTPGWMLRPALDVPGVRPVARWLTKPMHAFAVFNLMFCAWHLPLLYNAALEYHPLHIVEHLLFLATAVIMWWPILSPLPELPRLSYPGQMLYLFLMTLPMSVVSVYIALASSVLYPTYAAAPRLWGISPMADQMMGGLIMWIPGGVYFISIISVVFFRWQQRDGVDTAAGAQVDWRPT